MNRLKSRALINVADAAWQQKVYYQSAAMLEKALRRDPTNIRLIADLAMVHGKMRDYEAAEKLLERAAHLAPRKASAMRLIAQVYSTIDRQERAIDFYRRALELNSDAPTTVETLVALSALYERRHLLDDAGQVLSDALQRDPAHEKARLQQALLDRRTGDLERAESRLRVLVGQQLNSLHVASSAWYELGQLLDKRAQFDEAYQAFRNAKRCVLPERPKFLQSSEHVLAKCEEMLNSLNAGRYDQWNSIAKSDVPCRSALLTSYPRSGTTLAEQVLDSHNGVISADEFDVLDQWVFQPLMLRFSQKTPILDVIEHVPHAVRCEARQTYLRRTEAIFGAPIGERLLLDKNPALTPMMPFVNWAFPEMKLLIALRDPRDVVLSCFMQKVPLTSVSVHWLTLEEAASDYARTMNSWLKLRKLTTSKWLEFRYEDMVNDLEREARRLLEFLELPWDDDVLKFHEHAREKAVRSPTYEAVTKPVYRGSVGRWENYAKHFNETSRLLEPFIKEFGYNS